MELDTLGVERGAWCMLGGPQAPQAAAGILVSGGWREGVVKGVNTVPGSSRIYLAE